MGSEAFMTYEDREEGFYYRHKKPILAVLALGWILAIIFLALGITGVLYPAKPTATPSSTTPVTSPNTGSSTGTTAQTSDLTSHTPSPSSDEITSPTSNSPTYTETSSSTTGQTSISPTVSTSITASTGSTATTVFTLPTGTPPTIPADYARRVECLPDKFNVSQTECLMKGCNYYEDRASNGTKCFVDPLKSGYMFRIANISNHIRELNLTRKASAVPLYSEPFRSPRVQLDFRSKSVFHFKIFDAGNPRYEVPLPLNIPTDPPGTPSMYNYFGASLDVKDIRVLRADSRSYVWDMSPGGLYLEDQYLQITTLLGSPDCYGFGDNRHPHLKHKFDGRTWPLFSRDEAPIRPNDTDNLYGVHPFYMCMEEDGKAHGVFLLNSNAMEYQFHGSEKTPTLTIRTMGGVLDFYIFMGPTPENVIQQYTSLTGRSFMPPYWALGFQISRWGLQDLDHVRRIVDRNLAAKVPLEAVYGDIDYMAHRQDFTIDQEKYGNLSAYVDELHEKNMRYVIILDPAIHVDAATKHPGMEYRPYTDGVTRDVFIKWPAYITAGVDGVLADSIGENRAMLGKVWPDGRTAFPDFFKNETKEWWTDWINDLYNNQSLKFDAIWIDMNEVSSFGTNRDAQEEWYCNKPDMLPGNHTCFSLQCPKTHPLESPAYRPMVSRHWDENGTLAMLSDKTLCMIGQSTGKNGEIYNQYDVHNLYGWSQAEVTYRAAQEVRGERSFVFSRSTYPGSQQYVGHWLGDNAANVEEMRYSIIGMLEYSMFGYAYIGADICGFHDNTTVELCARWHALGAFYPFARNHNEQGHIDQDPAFHPAVAHVARQSLKLRYAFLPYLYTLFYRAHVFGETVARPLHHVFPEDHRVRSIDDQFFWGNALMISPIVHLTDDRTVYVPGRNMYNYYDGKSEDDVVTFDGSWEELSMDEEEWDNATDTSEKGTRYVPLHLRPGYIIPIQDPALTTTESRSNPFRLLITIDQNQPTAEGELFWDDGIGIDTYENGKYYLAQFSYDNNASPRFFNYTVVHNNGPDMSKMKLEELRLYTNVDRAYFDRLQFLVRTDFGIRPSVLCSQWHEDGYFSIFGPFEMDESFTIQIYRYVDERPRTKIDCAPDLSQVRQCDCNSRGCIWAGLFDNEEGGPVCVFPTISEIRTGYRALTADGQEYPPTTYFGSSRAVNVQLGLLQPNFPLRPNSYQRLLLKITPVTDSILRISFVPDEQRDDPAGNYTIPCFLAPWSCNLGANDPVTNPRYSYEIDNSNAGRVTFVRVKRGDSSGPVIWSTDVGALIYAHQYREITTRLPSEYVYGAGEHTHMSFQHDLNYKTWGLWSHDQTQNLFGVPQNLYGVHPYVMVVEDSKGNAFGSLLLNSNAMEMAFTPTPAITYRTTGGHLDFFLFVGDSPSDVNRIYTSFIGRPVLPPIWALGYQLSRGGWNIFANMSGAVRRTINAKIPLDVFYGDIDYLANQTNFLLNEEHFGELPGFIQEMHEKGVRFVTVVDPISPALPDNEAFQRALQKRDVFIRWPQGYIDTNDQSYSTIDPSQPPYLLGHVWPRAKAVFTDFFHPSGREWWKDEVTRFHQTVNFSGLWLDMNEPTNFGTNGDDVWYTYSPEHPWHLQCSNESALERPPYLPRSLETGRYYRLSQKTICLNAVQHDGQNPYDHYNVHSLYGHSQIAPSLEAAQAVTGQRSFVVSRSTFVGSGAQSGHWLGDNRADWDHLRQSVIGMLEFNLFGIPFVGADICGYLDDTTPELCARWHQLGAFYPFSRNHNTRGTVDQDPQALGDEVVRATKAAMERRYRLLPYLYTLFGEVNKNGGSVVRSLMEVFPQDIGARGIDQQFMWGDCILVTPVLTQGREKVTAYFPPAEWYDWVTGLETNTIASGQTKVLSAKRDEMIPVHIRGGCIIPTQGPGGLNTQESLTKEYTLGITTERERGRDTARGSLFWDGGLNIRNDDSNSTDFFVTFDYEMKLSENQANVSYNVTGTITIIPNNAQNVWGQELPIIATILIAGFPDVTSINNAAIVTNDEEPVAIDITSQIDHNREFHRLHIGNLSISLTNRTVITFQNNFDYPEPVSPDEEALLVDCLPDLIVVDPRTCLSKGCVPYVDSDGLKKCSIDVEATGYTLSRRPVPSKEARNILTYDLQPKPATGQLYSVPFVQPQVQLDQSARSMMHFKIFDGAKRRYEVPVPMNSYEDPVGSIAQYRLVIGDDFPSRDIRNIRIVRDNTGTVVWDMGLGGLYLEDQYLQITTKLNSTDCYGFGDNRHSSLKHRMDARTWPMFARDEPPTDSGKTYNGYGVHPFYMCMEADGSAHGVFLLNSNAMEYKFHKSTVNPALTLRSIGGVFDFYIFMGPTPENVIEQYTRLTGRSFMPPYWALGFQLSRWGFEKLEDVKCVVDRNIAAKIPLDAIYGDIDYMSHQQDFTIDQENFRDLPAYVDELHGKNMRYVIILDPFIHVDSATKYPTDAEYRPYTDGLLRDIFLEWPSNIRPGVDGVLPDSIGLNNAILGKAWPEGRVAYPDFFKSETSFWWYDWISDVYNNQSLRFDGIWLDMNEPSSWDTNRPANNESFFCNKPGAEFENHTCYTLQCPMTASHKLDNPPYKPMAVRVHGEMRTMADKTVCMVAGSQARDKPWYSQYDVHSLYGWSQAEVTYRVALAVRHERSFILSRSTYPGGQQYVGHWLGDNAANVEEMRYSIIGMLEYSMFGYAYMGADICGFWGDSSVELCAKWQALGAFYPFSRNHNSKGAIDQDPAYYPAVAHVARTTLNIRYTFLPYLYTLFYRAHVFGETVARPVHHVYPTDERARDIDDQFFWGPALMISPIVDERNDRDVYIPVERMYDYYDGVAEEANATVPLGSSWDILWEGLNNYTANVTVDPSKSANKYVGLYLRPGFIIPTQDPAVTTTESRTNPFRLIITVDREHPTAEGELFWDDGVGIDTFENGNYYLAKFSYDNTAYPRFFNYTVLQSGVDMSKMKIAELRIYTNVETEYFESLQFVVRSGFGTISPSVLCTEWQYSSDGTRLYFRMFGPFEMNDSFQIRIYKYKEHQELPITMIDCAPDIDNVRECDCQNRACHWNGRGPGTNPGEAACVYPENYILGYRWEDETDEISLPPSDTAPLTRTLTLQNQNFAVRRGSYEKIRLQITPISEFILRISFVPASNNDDRAGNYTVPCFLAPWSCDISLPEMIPSPSYSYEVLDNDTSTYVQVRRRIRQNEEGPVIWSTEVGAMVFAHQYREITTKVASEYVYGSGENSHDTFKRDMNFQTYGMWARDQSTGDRTNLYGVHPYVMVVENDEGMAFGSLLLNSNAMEMAFTPTPAITYRTTGGHLDFFLFVGFDPSHVNSLYHGFIGKPFLPPFWALGFQISRYGYNTFEKMRDAVERTLQAQIPLDVFYGDIDYFVNETNFLIDEDRFGPLPDYVQRKLDEGLRFVTILDPINPADESNEAFQRGLQKDSAFIRWPAGYIDTNNQSYPHSTNASQGPYLLGHVWPPAKSVFTDFFHPSGRQWWAEEVELFHNKINFSALWIDMNEPANFGTNGDDPWYTYSPEYPWSLQCSNDSALEHPQYIPRAIETGQFKRLSQKTICMDAIQNDGVNSYSHYNVHSLYGHSQIQASHSVMEQITGHRSFVVSRSTFPGSGAKAGHWLGDNAATWEQMAQSIIGMLDFNIFGIPYVGADICGFFGNATDEMCARWHQLGAFYPFARNHNSKDLIEQDPAAMGEVVRQAAKDAMDRRYRLLPYLYSHFVSVSLIGGTVVKSLMEKFPMDLIARNIDKQFMWGDCLLVTPVLSPNATTVTGYFPEGQWYDYVTGEMTVANSSGLYKTLPAAIDQLIPVHIAEGCIVPLQGTGINTAASSKTGYTLGIAPRYHVYTAGDDDHEASGFLAWDGGEEIKDTDTSFFGAFFRYRLNNPPSATTNTSSQDGFLDIRVLTNDTGNWTQDMPQIETILIAGFPEVDEMVYIEYRPKDGGPIQYFDIGDHVDYNNNTKVLRIRDVNIPVTRPATILFRNFGEPNPSQNSTTATPDTTVQPKIV